MTPASDDRIPNRYQINPQDDRRLTGADRAAYFEIATALDAIGNLYEREEWVKPDGTPAPLVLGMQPKARTAIRSAENALRRAAWMIVVFAPEPTA